MVFGDELGGRLHQDRDDFEGPAAERHGNPARPELPPAEVDLPLIAHIDQIGACFRHTRPLGLDGMKSCLFIGLRAILPPDKATVHDQRPSSDALIRACPEAGTASASAMSF